MKLAVVRKRERRVSVRTKKYQEEPDQRAKELINSNNLLDCSDTKRESRGFKPGTELTLQSVLRAVKSSCYMGINYSN